MAKQQNPHPEPVEGQTTQQQTNQQINNKQQTKPYLPEPAEGKKIPLIP